MLDPNEPLEDGTYRTWRGRTYVGSATTAETVRLLSTDPEEGFVPRALGRGYEREVPSSEVQVWSLTTRATWRGHTFQVLDRGSDQTLLGYLGRSQREAESLGAVMVEPGVFTVTVPTGQVTDVRQDRSPA